MAIRFAPMRGIYLLLKTDDICNKKKLFTKLVTFVYHVKDFESVLTITTRLLPTAPEPLGQPLLPPLGGGAVTPLPAMRRIFLGPGLFFCQIGPLKAWFSCLKLGKSTLN